ncbi:MAG: hypothetical protein AVDCRST_MAG42-2708 [uncultured Chthoniobacterales bacterium]|uniref:Uncharacterized protein n=1 Tax=uncultured Chthoniobacterales bacterium TaxID=1836801 RepID=A0A6J4INC8_9BACT|nr:MAG: hypothetical protein AVDCRST_MAG42-2708 [uncultured Chthoniobacterales bacterium]
MKREDDQELWDLLGRADAPALSPFFARNVVRQIRQEPDWRENMRRWFSPRRLIPAAAVALALVATTLSFRVPHASDENVPDTVAQLDPKDYEVVADLDDLIASEEDGLWDDDTPTL